MHADDRTEAKDRIFFCRVDHPTNQQPFSSVCNPISLARDGVAPFSPLPLPIPETFITRCIALGVSLLILPAVFFYCTFTNPFAAGLRSHPPWKGPE